jgi:hypothetical protein
MMSSPSQIQSRQHSPNNNQCYTAVKGLPAALTRASEDPKKGSVDSQRLDLHSYELRRLLSWMSLYKWWVVATVLFLQILRSLNIHNMAKSFYWLLSLALFFYHAIAVVRIMPLGDSVTAGVSEQRSV